MVHIVGAGPGAEDLITVRGLKFLKQADIVIYAGSLVNPGLLKETKQDAMIYDSAKMTLEQVMEVIEQAWKEHKQEIHAFTELSESRWMLWTSSGSSMISVRESVLFAARQQLYRWNTLFREYPRAWSLPGWQEGHLCRKERASASLLLTRQRWWSF